MAQLNFFDQNSELDILPGLLDYKARFFSEEESNILLHRFITEIPWEQRSVLMYGKEVITPRLTAWFGDLDVDYSVHGTGATPLLWTKDLLMIRDKITPLAGIEFNSVLLNYYRDGNDSVSWHTDNDGIPGRNRIVASISFGQTRRFDIRNKNDHSIKYAIDLENGSYLLMKGNFQDEWQHRIAKSSAPMNPRVNLTFRMMNKVA